MSVALVHWAFPPTVGGVESHLWWYSRLLARQGHRVTVFTGTDGALTPRQPGVEVVRHEGLDLSRASADPGATETLRRWFAVELKRRGIRLVHGHNLHHFSTAPAEALLSLRSEHRLVLVHTYHSLWRGAENVRTAKSCGQWDVHFAVSDFLRDACARELGIEDVHRTYLGIDVEAYLGVPELTHTEWTRTVTVLLPARLIPDKGAELAIRAIGRLVRRSPELDPHLLLMDTPDSVDFHGEKVGFRKHLEKLIAEVGLVGRVAFEEAGVERMPDLYRRAHVVIHPSSYEEPMGLAPLEAMCAARPVIATRMGGLSEGVGEDGVYGYLVPDQDVDKLAQRMTQLLRDPELARLMGKRGRQRVVGEFDLARCYVPEMLRVYRNRLEQPDS
ncbi:glycosyltransferase family 4 protein [Streptomyces sp. SAS_270]|uniref:glycosyltransferase family 4 protein n=1 Tax=Streptomyces sp. SAS_270 TaxID=3412748 RepID=UPI00403D438F